MSEELNPKKSPDETWAFIVDMCAETEKAEKLSDAELAETLQRNIADHIPMDEPAFALIAEAAERLKAKSDELTHAKSELAYLKLQRDRLLEITWLDLPDEPSESTAKWQELFKEGWIRRAECAALKAVAGEDTKRLDWMEQRIENKQAFVFDEQPGKLDLRRAIDDAMQQSSGIAAK